MELRQLGGLWPVSVLTLGGGGLGNVWGETTRSEAVATVQRAVDAGITLIDMAPGYGRGEAEEVVGEAFDGRLPPGMRLTTKVQLGSPPAEEVEKLIRRRLARSLETMRVDAVDILFLHSNIVPEGYVMANDAEHQHRFATDWNIYRKCVVPVFESLVGEGLIGAWGITGVGLPDTVIEALSTAPLPRAVQVVANLLDSPGSMRRYAEPAKPREIMAVAKRFGVGVLGIRAVQAGALTAAFDRVVPPGHPEARDFDRAAPFRAFCEELGEDPAIIAHRYALSMDAVDTVILGVKNRQELDACLDAEAEGPLAPELIDEIDALIRGGT